MKVKTFNNGFGHPFAVLLENGEIIEMTTLLNHLLRAGPQVAFKKLHPAAVLPKYETAGAAGMDLMALADFKIYRDDYEVISTGLAIEIPPGYEAQVRPRSGLALKHGLTVLNSPGTIDSDYRGEVRVLLQNHGGFHYEGKAGDRIAQLVVAPVVQATIVEVKELTETARGAGGFGSTGVK